MELLQSLNSSVTNIVAKSDSKAAFSLAYNGVLLASLGFNARLVEAWTLGYYTWIISAFSLVLSAAFLFSSIFPRIHKGSESKLSFLSFGQMSAEAISSLCEDDVKETLKIEYAKQIHDLSLIASQKFRLVSIGMSISMGGSVLWVGFFVVLMSQ